MKRLQLVIAVAAACLSSAAMATSSITYSGLATDSAPMLSSTNGGAGTASGTTFANASSSQYCFNGASGCAAGGGTNYGNTYSFASAASNTGTGPSFTLAAYGSQSTSLTSTLTKAWVGNYGSNGFGITSQSTGELTANNLPDASSPNYQHAIDNVSAYETLLFSFASAVTVNGISIGFKGSDADATVFEYVGSGDPTAALTTQSYSTMLSSGNWKIAGNLTDMAVGGFNALSTAGNTASKYWMVGAYIPNLGTNGAGDGINDSFKVNGISLVGATSVPEPGSIALLGIAGVAFAASRRRARKA